LLGRFDLPHGFRALSRFKGSHFGNQCGLLRCPVAIEHEAAGAHDYSNQQCSHECYSKSVTGFSVVIHGLIVPSGDELANDRPI
jgi:hypothetical protein